jgi:hypothetical protein
MQAHEGVKLQLNSLLTSALDGGQRASLPIDRSISRRGTSGIHLHSRLSQPQRQADCFEEDNLLHPAEVTTTIPRIQKPQATHRTEF